MTALWLCWRFTAPVVAIGLVSDAADKRQSTWPRAVLP